MAYFVAAGKELRTKVTLKACNQFSPALLEATGKHLDLVLFHV